MIYVLVCQHQSCATRGSLAVLAAFQAADLPKNVQVVATGCQGQCHLGVTVRIIPEETWYCRVQPEDVLPIVKQHLHLGKRVETKLHPRIHFSYNCTNS